MQKKIQKKNKKKIFIQNYMKNIQKRKNIGQFKVMILMNQKIKNYQKKIMIYIKNYMKLQKKEVKVKEK